MIAAVIHVVGETRSFERAELTLRHVLGHAPSPKTIERLAHQVGGEKEGKKGRGRLGKKGSIPKVLGRWVVCGRDQSRKGWVGWGLVFSGRDYVSLADGPL